MKEKSKEGSDVIDLHEDDCCVDGEVYDQMGMV